MDKQLPILLEDNPVIQEYLSNLSNHHQFDDMKNMEELLNYIARMEFQFAQVSKELSEVKDLLSQMKSPTAKERLNQAVSKTEDFIDKGKSKLSDLKVELVNDMKQYLAECKKKGKAGVVKTIHVMKFKSALNGIHNASLMANSKMKQVIQTCDSISSEMRQSMNHFKNAGRMLLGKSPINHKEDMQKLNFIQRGCRTVSNGLQRIASSTLKVMDKIENFERPSVKQDMKLIGHSTKSSITRPINKGLAR